MSWVIPFRHSLHQYEESKFGSLLSLLSNVFLYRGEADRHIWKLYSLWSFLFEILLEGVGVFGKSQIAYLFCLVGFGFLLELRLSVGLFTLERSLQLKILGGEISFQRTFQTIAYSVVERQRRLITCFFIVCSPLLCGVFSLGNVVFFGALQLCY